MIPNKLSILAIQKIRKHLEHNTNHKLALDKGFINYMKYLLTCDGQETLQMEAAWIITNIAAGSTEQTKLVVDSGVVTHLIRLLSSKNTEVVGQCIWALGNVIGEGTKYRDLMISEGLLAPLVSFVPHPTTVSFQRTLAWVFVNIVRNREDPLDIKYIEEIVPSVCELALKRDHQTKIDALWALTFIADGGVENIQLIIDNDIVEPVILMLNMHNQKLQISAMRFLGNISTGTDEQTQVILDYGILENIRFALIHHNRNLRRVALWCLSNITIGTQAQAQEVFHSGLLPAIIDNLHHDDEKILLEAVLNVRNMINAGAPEQMLDLIEHRCIPILFTLILKRNAEIAEAARTSLTVLFTKGLKLVEKYTHLQMFQVLDTSSSP